MKLWYVFHIWNEFQPPHKIKATFVTYGESQEEAISRVQAKRGCKGEWVAMPSDSDVAQLSVSF